MKTLKLTEIKDLMLSLRVSLLARLLYYIAFVIYVFEEVLSLSTAPELFGVTWPEIINILQHITLIFLLVKYLIQRNSAIQHIIAAAIVALGYLSWRITLVDLLFWVAVFVVASKDININTLAKIVFVESAAAMLVLFILSREGFVEDVTVVRTDSAGNQVTRHAFGFAHPNTLGLYMVVACMALSTIRFYKSPFLDFVVIACFVYANLRWVDSRSAVVICVMLAIFRTFFYCVHHARLHRFFVIVSAIFVCLVMLTSFWAVFCFDETNSLLNALDNALSGRLSLAYGYHKTIGPIKAFGYNLNLFDAVVRGNYTVSGATIDNIYAHYLIRFGYVPTAVYCGSLLALYIRFIKQKRWDATVMGLTLMLIYGFSETHSAAIACNFFLVALSELLYSSALADGLTFIQLFNKLSYRHKLSRDKRLVGFILPGLDISGGILVALKHAAILQRAGHTVVLFDLNSHKSWYYLSFENTKFLVMGLKDQAPSEVNQIIHFDKLIATGWNTLDYVEEYSNVTNKYYLVQNYETDFYTKDNPFHALAEKTYGNHQGIIYCTISTWCQSWLSKDYGHDSRYAPNGIDLKIFPNRNRKWDKKIRILIEGNSDAHYKNVDESFRIVNDLDSDKYEIWYMSYGGGPKDWYCVDKVFQKVPHDEVGAIYAQCHILLKTSLLESFSYPPLEMMATGGVAVVLENEGNLAYLKDGINSLLFKSGEYDKAISLIEGVVADPELRNRLIKEGIATAQQLSWENIEQEILDLYA